MKLYSFIKCIPVIFFAGMFFSCVNSVSEIERLTYSDKSPAQILNDAEIEYSDSGYVKSILRAPIIEKYNDETGRTVFPKGVEVVFYNENREPESTIRADFGELKDNAKFLELKRNIVIISYSKKDTLYTEYLKKVPGPRDSLNVTGPYLVIVRGNSGNFECQGIRARDNFSKYIFGKTKGVINYNEEEETE